MNNLKNTTITTLEVAEMMETEHWKLLRKLDGRTGKDGEHERGYIEILADNHLVVTDYFLKSTYRTEQNKEMPCYEVTRLGCDFLANKSTGEKGILFTARYVKKFYEMENHIVKALAPTDHPGEVANLLKAVSRLMEKQGSAPYEITENARTICDQYGIVLSPKFVKPPENQQMQLSDFLGR